MNKKAVVFDMFETLITMFESPQYMGREICADMGIPEPKFREIWNPTEDDRTLGKITVEEVFERILRTNGCYTDELFARIVEKRRNVTVELFDHLHPEIIPMLEALKVAGIKVALISNCFFEERDVIKESALWPYFDVACLSCELGMKKPGADIFAHCLHELGVRADECLYVGDGGSNELEAATASGMQAAQACWYLKEGTRQPVGRLPGWVQLDKPMDVVEQALRAAYEPAEGIARNEVRA